MIYNRCSTEEESQKDALLKQVQESQNCVLEQGWQLVDVYVEAKSGTTRKGRCEYNRLYQDLQRDSFDIIVIKSQDRLMRNTKDWYLFLERMQKNGKRLYMYLEHKFYSPEDALITGIKAILAEEYSRELSKKINNAHRNRQKEGKHFVLTSQTYGFRKLPDKSIALDEAEAEMVRTIFKLSANGYGTHSIAAILYQNGYRNRNGNMLSPSRIRNMLRNPVYKGTVVQNRQHFDFESKQVVKNRQSEWIVHKDAVPAIVEPDLFEKANQGLDSRKRGNNRKMICGKDTNPGNFSLSGKISCGICGSPFYRTVRRKKDGQAVEWKCSNYLLNGRKKQQLSIVQAGNLRQAGNVRRIENLMQAENPSQAGKTEQAENLSQAGKTEQAGNPSQAGKTEQAGNPSQAGKTEQVGNPSQAGKAGQVGNASQAGKTEQVGNPSQAGKTEQVGNPSQAGKAGQVGNPSQAENLSQAGRTEQVRNPSQAGKTEQARKTEQAGKTEQAENPSQAKKAGQAASFTQTGILGCIIELEQTGNTGYDEKVWKREMKAIDRNDNIAYSIECGRTCGKCGMDCDMEYIEQRYTGCDNVHLDEKKLYSTLEQLANENYGGREMEKEDLLRKTLEIVRKALRKDYMEKGKRELEISMERMACWKSRLLQKLLEHVITDEEFKIKNKELQERMGQVQERLKQWEDNNVRTIGFDERMEAIRIKLESGLIEQAKMICMVENIRKIEVTPNHLEISFTPQVSVGMLGRKTSLMAGEGREEPVILRTAQTCGSSRRFRIEEEKRRVLDLMGRNPKITAKEIAVEMGANLSLVHRRIRELKQEGKIRYSSPNGRGEWQWGNFK